MDLEERAVTDVGLWAVARYCTALRKLRLQACDQITVVGLRALSLRIGRLLELGREARGAVL